MQEENAICFWAAFKIVGCRYKDIHAPFSKILLGLVTSVTIAKTNKTGLYVAYSMKILGKSGANRLVSTIRLHYSFITTTTRYQYTRTCQQLLPCDIPGWVHDDVIKWNHFPRHLPFVPHKGQWHGALMFSLICAWINGWVNDREAGDLRRHRAHYDVTVMRNCIEMVASGMLFGIGYCETACRKKNSHKMCAPPGVHFSMKLKLAGIWLHIVDIVGSGDMHIVGNTSYPGVFQFEHQGPFLLSWFTIMVQWIF